MSIKLNLGISFYLIDSDGKSELVFHKDNDAWLIAFHTNLYLRFAYTTASITDISNTPRSVVCTYPASVLALFGDPTYGIQVGTGTNVVTINDYKLGTPIVHGSGAGELWYHQTQYSGMYVPTGTSNLFKILRSLSNQSGGSITINEVGLAAVINTWKILFARDLVSPGVSIADQQAGSLLYNVSISV